MGDKRIVTTEKSEDGTFFLRITGDNYPMKDGERFKIISMEDGFQLRSLEAPSGIFERICMDIECDDIFKIMMERYPKYAENTGILQFANYKCKLDTRMNKNFSAQAGLDYHTASTAGAVKDAAGKAESVP